jgi:hypothetical protein
MAMPLHLTMKLGTYLVKQKLRGVDKFPLIMELEPLFACNLKCAGCGKIQHPAPLLKQRMPVEQAVAAVEECGARQLHGALRLRTQRRARHHSVPAGKPARPRHPLTAPAPGSRRVPSPPSVIGPLGKMRRKASPREHTPIKQHRIHCPGAIRLRQRP